MTAPASSAAPPRYHRCGHPAPQEGIGPSRQVLPHVAICLSLIVDTPLTKVTGTAEREAALTMLSPWADVTL